MSKVARITLWFWVMKICATTLGETAGDLLSMTLGLGYAASSLILLGGFMVALAAQLRASRFHPLLFWTVILATSTVGTTMSDYMDRTLGLGYATGALLLVLMLALVLAVWRTTLGSLAVDAIATPRAEAFYWTAILVSNTLGTALGDYLADDSGLGFMGSAALIALVLAALAAAYRWSRLDHVLLFWAAFVLTRPFGATFGDVLTKPLASGGLDLGTAGSSLVLFLVLAATIMYRAHADPDPEKK
jgi:uncharacterized membrane-anchored protein